VEVQSQDSIFEQALFGSKTLLVVCCKGMDTLSIQNNSPMEEALIIKNSTSMYGRYETEKISHPEMFLATFSQRHPIYGCMWKIHTNESFLVDNI